MKTIIQSRHFVLPAMAPFAEEHTGSNFATKPTASSCTQKKWWSRLEKDLRKMGLFHFSMLTCSPTAWRSCTSCALFCGTCVLLQTTRGGSNFHIGLFLLKTAEDGHGAVCRVLDNYYYPGEAWNSTLGQCRNLKYGCWRGRRQRKWTEAMGDVSRVRNVLPDDTFVILSAGGTFEESRWKWQGRCMHG